MILLWGITADGPLASVRAALAAMATPVAFLDQQEILGTGIELTVDSTLRGVLRLPAMDLPLEAIRAVYARPYDTRRIAAVERAGPDSSEWRHALLCESTLSCWANLTSALVVNRPSAMGSNISKPYQASLIQSWGFDVPDTLVTTDRSAAIAFRERHGTVIYKSISAVRSVVSRLRPEHHDRLADIANCPTQFQEYIEGMDVRVHVVGDDVFGCEIESTADDYRYAGLQDCVLHVRPCEVPVEIADRCRSLAAGLNLAVAGIDLRLRPDGRWYCFEVNPSPGFTFYEGLTGQPIAASIARLLAAGK